MKFQDLLLHHAKGIWQLVAHLQVELTILQDNGFKLTFAACEV
jgi:hypothetical protein